LLHGDEGSAGQPCRELAPDGLDLGEFRHRRLRATYSPGR
jgi:hypothetical protein